MPYLLFENRPALNIFNLCMFYGVNFSPLDGLETWFYFSGSRDNDALLDFLLSLQSYSDKDSCKEDIVIPKIDENASYWA